MNANQIVRTVMRQLINRGVNAGFRQISQRKAGSGGQGPQTVSPERQAQMEVRRARRAARAQQQR